MGELVQRNGDLYGDGNYAGWSFKETIADGETGDPVKIDPSKGQANATVQINCAGTGKVQFTLETFALIDSGDAVWTDWAKGNVTGTDQDVTAGPITGLKAVSVAGQVVFNILI